MPGRGPENFSNKKFSVKHFLEKILLEIFLLENFFKLHLRSLRSPSSVGASDCLWPTVFLMSPSVLCLKCGPPAL